MKVIKRNGSIEDLNIDKVINAVKKAYISQGERMPPSMRRELEYNIPRFFRSSTIGVEDIQDAVEGILMDIAPNKVAKAYMLYREQHKQARFVRERLDYMDHYADSEDNAATSSETDPNANVTMKNVANLEGEVYKSQNRIIQRQRMKDKLNEMFPEVAKQYEKDLNNHIIYVHDEASSPALKPYCMAASLYPLMMEGTGNIDGVTPKAPNDIQSFSGQVTNLVFLLSSQVKGAVALGDYFVALNYYVVKEFGDNWHDLLDYSTTSPICEKQRTVKDVIRKGMKQFIFGINQPAGNRSYNSPFSNISYYDSAYFNELFKDFAYPDGSKPTWAQIDTLQRIFMELHRELRLIKPLTFPVSTMALVYDEKGYKDEAYKQLCAEEWAKGGSFFCYQSNNPSSLASCCRVLNEIQDNTFSSTIGLTGIMTGSVNVITLNINRIVQNWWKEYNVGVKDGQRVAINLLNWSYKESALKNSFKKYLTDILERVYAYHIAYKTMLYEQEDKGMFSSSNAGYIYLKKLYSTIGLIGYCEAAQFLGLEINDNPEYKEFLQLIFGTVKEQNKLHSIKDKKKPFLFNSEAIPGENVAHKLYEWDKEDNYIVPGDQNLYSSYFFKQWDNSLSILDKLKLHNKDINTFCDGGQACHLHLNEHLSKEQYLKILDFTKDEGVNYFTFNIPVSECKDCGHVVNAPIKECPKCKSTNIDWWVRIIGYLRPISAYSEARQIEASKRVYGTFKD